MTVRINPRINRLAEDFTASIIKAMPQAVASADTEFRKNMQQNFATQGESGGPPWQKLSGTDTNSGYFKYKQKKRPGRKILTFDGNLRDSLAEKTPEHEAYWWAHGGRVTISLGTRNPIAHYHEEGNPPLPRRSPIQQKPHQKIAVLEKVKLVFIPHITRAIRDDAVLKGGM